MSSIIEQNGIHVLKSFLFEKSHIVPSINDNDRTPSWDGEILLYSKNSDGNPKNKLIGKVPVQIKSKKYKYKWHECEKFSIDISDLKNYGEDGGVFIIRPTFKGVDEFRIYGKLLFPVQISAILENNNNNTHSIDLPIIQTSDEFEERLKYFIKNRKLQKGVFLSGDVLIAESDFVITGLGLYQDPRAILSADTLIYQRNKSGDLTPVMAKIVSVKSCNGVNIEIDGIRHFSQVTAVYDENGLKIQLDTVVSLEQEGNSISFNVSCDEKSLVKDYFNFIDFYKHSKDCRSIAINGETIGTLTGCSVNSDEICKWESMRKLFILLRIDFSRVTFKEIESNSSQIEELVRLLINKEVALIKDEDDRGVLVIVKKIFGKNVVLLLNRIEEGRYTADSLMGCENVSTMMRVDDAPVMCSKYLIPFFVCNRDIMDIYIGFEDDVINDMRAKYSDLMYERYIEFFLELLKKYDECLTPSLLILANELIDLLKEKATTSYASDICYLNKVQVMKRQGREIGDDDVSRLIVMKNKDTDIMVNCAISVLLGGKKEAVFYYQKMSDDWKKVFQTWPIYCLYKECID